MIFRVRRLSGRQVDIPGAVDLPEDSYDYPAVAAELDLNGVLELSARLQHQLIIDTTTTPPTILVYDDYYE